jgi:D-alanyl-D-alanine carboxypeptidase
MARPTLMSRRRALARLLLAGVTGLAALTLVACAGPSTPSANGARSPHSSTPNTSRPRPSRSATPFPVPTPTFDKTAHSVDDPSSIWFVVNKPRAIVPARYEPADLVYPDVVNINHQPMRQETATALLALFAAGKAEAGLDFSVQSAYRPFDSQKSIYDSDVASHGVGWADNYTARPGHSEHQTGLAVDISAVPAKCSLDPCFAETPHAQWLKTNAWRFGFLLRYPAEKVDVTGYSFEPWHFRYIGVPLATEMHTTGVSTLEEFFGVKGGTAY